MERRSEKQKCQKTKSSGMNRKSYLQIPDEQGADGVEDSQDHHAHIGEYGQPHIGQATGAQDPKAEERLGGLIRCKCSQLGRKPRRASGRHGDINHWKL